MLVHRANKLRATYSSIPPGLINKVHSIYSSVPWFRFTLMDLSFRVLFHRFQIIFDRIRLTFSFAIGTKSTNAIKYSPGNCSCFRRSCSWTYRITKLFVSPNKHLNNVILERTIQYNTTQPQNSTAKESNATSEIESTLIERPKSTLPARVLTC